MRQHPTPHKVRAGQQSGTYTDQLTWPSGYSHKDNNNIAFKCFSFFTSVGSTTRKVNDTSLHDSQHSGYYGHSGAHTSWGGRAKLPPLLRRDWGKIATKGKRRRREEGKVWPFAIHCTTGEVKREEHAPKSEPRGQRQLSRGCERSRHGVRAPSRVRGPLPGQVRINIYKRLLSMCLHVYSCCMVHANVYVDPHPGPSPPGGWGVWDPLPDVSIGYLDGFANSYWGPDLHQQHWGQMGGGDMPAMGQERITAPAAPAGVTLFPPKIWNQRSQAEEEGGLPAQDEHLSILTVNITYMSVRVRKWLSTLPYDIIMIQEHHKHTRKSLGRIDGYSIIFSPAHVTHVKKRRKGKGNIYHTKGGVAILYRPNLTRFLQPGLEMTGHNWCALIIKLAKNRGLNLITSYIPHGTTQDGTRTIVEVNKYLDRFKVPFVWGGDFNRSPEECVEQGLRQGGHYVVAPHDESTCVGGGRIDYFITNGAREHLHGGCQTVPGKVRPHSPVLMKVKYRPHLTKVKGLTKVKVNLAEGLEASEGTRRKGPLTLLDAIPTWQDAEAQYAAGVENLTIRGTKPYMNQEQAQYVEAVGGARGQSLMQAYAKWSDTHTLHLAARQGYTGGEALKLLGKGHTPVIRYSAPGRAATHKDLTREDALGWVMHTGQRLHYLSRIPVDTQGYRTPTGRQQTSWMHNLEADLALQGVTIPQKLEGLSEADRLMLSSGLRSIASANRDSVNELRATTRKAYTKADKALKEQEQDDLTNWIDRILDPDKGYTEAHKWTRGTAKAPPLPTTLVIDDGVNKHTYGHPHELGTKYVRDWGALWTQPEYATWGEVAKMIRELSWDAEDMEPLTVRDLRRAIYSLRPGTATGLDQWRPDELRLITREGLEQLLALYQEVERHGVWPTGIVANIITLMGKPKGGSRPIALMPMFYRVWCRARRPYIDTWENTTAGGWDAAVKGSSALRASILSQLRDEVAIANGDDTLTILWDMEKFYDNICIARLLREACRLRYPMLVLRLGIIMHMAPRLLRTYNFIPGLVQPRNGIIAGCSQSTAFARVLLHGVLGRIHDSPWYGMVSIRSFVDDIRHTGRGKPPHLLHQMRDTAILLAEALRGIKCKISTKSVCISNRKKLKQEMVDILKGQGVTIQAVSSAPDLGVEAGGGHRRFTGVIRSRYGGTKPRADRAAWLNTKNKKARALYGTGVFPTATYGAETCGYYPQMVHSVRTMGADVVGTPQQGRCPITAIAIGKDITWDPWVRGPGMVIREVLSAVLKFGVHKVARVWETLWEHTTQAANPWATVKGPLGALCMHLHEVGWHLSFGTGLTRRLQVHSHQGEQWNSAPGAGWIDIQRAMDKRRIQLLWEQAARHRHGQGMEGGVDTTVIRKHYCILIKKGATARAGALMAIGTGALWPPSRVQEEIKGKEDMDTSCAHCGHHLHDERHMFWNCPVTNSKKKPSIRRTNGRYFDPVTGAIGEGAACYFLRGLMPAAWTTPSTQPEYIRDQLGSSSRDGCCLEGYRGCKIHIYTDGSGGHYTSDPRLRRCGWAWIVNRHSWTGSPALIAHYGQRGTMRDPGPESQTVPRAELEAVYHALRAVATAPWLEEVCIYSDCKAVVDGFTKGRELTLMGDMGALWYEVWDLHRSITCSGAVRLTVNKLKGHCSDPAVTSVVHQKGNWCADFHAGAAVREVPPKEAEAIRAKDRELWAIQERLIDILYLQDRRMIDPSERGEKPPRETQLHKAAMMGHVPQKIGSHYYCMRCGQSWRPQDTKRFTLMSRGDCMGAAMYDANPDLTRPWTLPPGMRVQVGKGRTHRTHHLCWYKGVFFCRRCGHYGQENKRILKLVNPCYDQRRDHQNITRMKSLEGGRKPDSVQTWPRPANIPGDGLKGLIHPQGFKAADPPTEDLHVPASDELHEWEDYNYVDPKTVFDEAEEEPWYWAELDAPPPEADYGDPTSPEECGHQQEAAEGLYASISDEPVWRPGDCDVPRSYYPATLRMAWRDSFLGPVHGIRPETGTYMGMDDYGVGDAPPTPVTGHTPPPSPGDAGTEHEQEDVSRAEEGMTLTQAHEWCYGSDVPGHAAQTVSDPHPISVSTSTVHAGIGTSEPPQSGEGDPMVPNLKDISRRLKEAANKPKDQDTQAKEEHTRFLRKVRDHRPDQCDAFDLTSGEATPVMKVDPRTGRVVEGTAAMGVVRRASRAADWAKDNASQVNACLETLHEAIEEDDDSLLQRVREAEAPLPQITDRWGNSFTHLGYGGGEYYRLSRQPIWLIRQLTARQPIGHPDTGHGEGSHDAHGSETRRE